MRLCAGSPPPARTVEAEEARRGATASEPRRPDCGCPSSCHAWTLVVNKSPRTARRIPVSFDARALSGKVARLPPGAGTSPAGGMKVPADWPARTACPRPLPPSRPRPQLASMRGTEKATACKDSSRPIPPLQICEPSWEVDCAAASPRIPSVGSAMSASSVCQLGRRFVHNARKAKSGKGRNAWR